MVLKRDFPGDGELVVGTVKIVKNHGAFVTLDEYPGKEGFIHIAEVASGWIKYVRDHVRENQKVVCKVVAVDPSKGHVDLSLKRVNEHQKREKINEWKNEQKAEKLFGLVAQELKKPVETCVDEFGLRLVEAYGSLYLAFETAAGDPEGLVEKGLTGAWTKAFIKVAQANIVLPSVTIKGQLEVSSEAPDGVEHVRKALAEVDKSDFEDVEIHIQYIGAPRYLVRVTAPDYKIAEEQLKKVADRAIAAIQKAGGKGSFTRLEAA